MAENGKWQIGFWVITFLVIGSFTWTTCVYLVNQASIERTRSETLTNYIALSDKYIALKDTSNDCLHKIDLRLSRIEDKLGI